MSVVREMPNLSAMRVVLDPAASDIRTTVMSSKVGHAPLFGVHFSPSELFRIQALSTG